MKYIKYLLLALLITLSAPAMASQSAMSEAGSLSGSGFRVSNNAGKAALLTLNKGSSAPSYAQAGTQWLDDNSTPWVLKQYDGTDWIGLGEIDATNNTFNPYIGSAALRILNYAADTGAANAYAVAPSPPITAYAAGLLVTLKVAHNQTASSTLEVNGLGAKTVKTLDGSNLASGMMVTTGSYLLMYDGTNFVLLNSVTTDATLSVSEVTTNNASTSAHGFLRKLDGNASHYLDGTGALSTPPSVTTKLIRSRILTSGTSYAVPSDVSAFYAIVSGSTGAIKTSLNTTGGVGGGGYSEKYYPSPSGPYSYTIGAGGTTSTGTAGSTTTFDVMTVTGSGGVTNFTGSSGGVGSGGDFNASGGNGANAVSGGGAYQLGGGGGGAGSRAGNGGNGSNASAGSYAGAGGGTGGNNASGITGGAAASSASGSAISLPFKQFTESFQPGGSSFSFSTSPQVAYGGSGATGGSTFDISNISIIAGNAGSGGLGSFSNQVTPPGSNGYIQIIEILK